MSISPYRILFTAALLLGGINIYGQNDFDAFNQPDEISTYGAQNHAFNPHGKDSTEQKKEIPIGLKVWTVDRKFGDIIEAEVDTMPHLFPQSTLGTGRYGQYNTVGSNYTARLNRIFIDRKDKSQFAFLDAYDQVHKQPNEWHFTRTLSPITNLTYDNCGDKQNGEDHLDAKFAVNAGKKLGFGFDLDYAYARGYYQNQSISHFGASFWAAYTADQYQLHALFSTFHEKATENGGITNDNYITHPELSGQTFQSNEIPVFLQSHWNRNDNNHLFLTHRYALGFYRQVKMTEDEIKARKFAEASAKDNADKKKTQENETEMDEKPEPQKTVADNSPRIKVTSQEMADSLLAAETLMKDSTEQYMKSEFVPVTSFIHTLEIDNHERRYLAYQTPDSLFKNSYFDAFDDSYYGDSICDMTNQFSMKNTLAIALLEGFNKYVPAGLKVFATHEIRRFKLPQVDVNNTAIMQRYNEHNISIGGQIRKSLGHTLDYDLMAETWVVGEDFGQLKLDASADLNFAFLGDTVRLMAKGYVHRLNPTFYERHYHSKHFWWDNNLGKETRTRVEGTFAYEKTNTSLRVAVEEIQNYTYLGMSYNRANEKNTLLSAGIRQHSGNLNVMTAQLDQRIRLGILHWDNLITYQSSSNEDVLPLPSLNVFSNLYLDFMIAKVLKVELGGSATWFTEYKAPEFCSALNQFAVQENANTVTKIGNFPFVDLYANLHLKHARFFLLMQNVAANAFNKRYFLTPHYPMNASVLHFGVSWNFFN